MEADISQEKLAEFSGLDRTYISLIERGKRKPTVETLVQIAKALKVKPSLIMKLCFQFQIQLQPSA